MIADFIVVILPGGAGLIFSIGSLFIVIAFTRQPKLAYIHPFKALRVTVIESKGGLPLFTHTWRAGEGLMDDTLFSGMMHAIGQFVQESLQRGGVRVIELDQGHLILKKSNQFQVICVLIANKPTKILRNALNCFAERFFKQFSQYFSDPTDKDKFKPASKLIEICFPFIPEYD